jgi:hypothetical protein
VDPLSWFTGPSLPLVFGGLSVVFAAAAALWVTASSSLLEWLAVIALAMAAGCLVVFTRKRERPLSGWRAAAPILLSWVAVILSALGYRDGFVRLELWWAPIALGILLGGFAPYSSPTRMLTIGGLGTLATLAGTLLLLRPTPAWPTMTQIVLSLSTVLVATAATTTFSYQVVRRILVWGASGPAEPLTSGVLGEAAKLRILRRELARSGERALPLLERVSETGVVTPEDREAAARLAEELRAELVERANRSWLDLFARELNITVIDRDHRADRMTRRQRSALIGLLRAGSDNGAGEDQPLVIELRGEPDGSTAVAISTDLQLPEGRRVLLLAPHYITLKAAVDELHWESGEQLRMRFRLPPPAGR